MDRYKETFDTWNKVASAYQDKFMNLDLYDETYDFFYNLIEKEKAQILDTGCGPGNISKYLLERCTDFQISGIDVAPNMINLSKKNVPGGDFRIMDIRNISQLRAHYDGIICGFCLTYLSKHECHKFIDDSYQLLSDKGVLYLSFVEGSEEQSGFIIGRGGDRMYFYYHGSEEIKHKLSEMGFELVKTFTINYEKSKNDRESHIILIARRS